MSEFQERKVFWGNILRRMTEAAADLRWQPAHLRWGEVKSEWWAESASAETGRTLHFFFSSSGSERCQHFTCQRDPITKTLCFPSESTSVRLSDVPVVSQWSTRTSSSVRWKKRQQIDPGRLEWEVILKENEKLPLHCHLQSMHWLKLNWGWLLVGLSGVFTLFDASFAPVQFDITVRLQTQRDDWIKHPVERWGLSFILKPATRGRSIHFGFTFGEQTCHQSLFKV